MLDSVQKRLPRQIAVPYIGWHPVKDKMTNELPYDHTKVSWQRGVRRKCGIPAKRKK